MHNIDDALRYLYLKFSFVLGIVFYPHEVKTVHDWHYDNYNAKLELKGLELD